MKQKTLFFDFDGTIVDTKTIYYRAMHDALKGFGYKYKDVDKAVDWGGTLKSMLGKMGLGWIVSWFVKKKIMSRVKKHVDEVKKCKDADSIGRLSGKKILVSNSLKEFILPVVKHLKLKKYFKEIYGAEDFSNKAKFLRDYIKEKGLGKADCYYIGDRVADIKVGKEVGCNSVIVYGKCAWDSKKELMKAKPDFLMGDLRELGGIVKK